MRINLKSQNIKIYAIILLASLFVILLGLNSYNNAKEKIIELSDKNNIAVSKNIVNNFQVWLNERINSLVRASKFIQNADIVGDDDKIAGFIRLFKQNEKEFDLIQVLRDDGEIFVNGQKISEDVMSKQERVGLIWYLETKNTNAPSVNFMKNHKILNSPTLNLCVPVEQNDGFKAALCGIVRIENIFNSIKNFNLTPNSYAFLVTHSGEILTPLPDLMLKKEIEENFKELFLKDEDFTCIKIGQNLIQIAEIPMINWFIGAGTNNEDEISALTREILKNALTLLFAFVALTFLANILHNFMYNKIKKMQYEYETLLAHRAKMGEAGELVSGINHQFIQPVNSLKLMLSSAIMLKKDKKLSDDELINLLEKGQRSVELLSSTIEIFRNFYKSAENVSEFDIQTSVKNLLTLMHTELSRVNVSVNLRGFNGQKAYQIENIIQQILLILIHNAKDSLVESYKDEPLKRIIEIRFRSFENKSYIGVYDNGNGVSQQMSEKIFTWLNTTKKQGNGIGLYFAKKLAREKLNGDVKLINNAKPTVFELSFETNLKD
ncbi:ATP-binding protein [Campylobacter sp.]|uniref:sensor histidine kinase n=1 Tax=Campylobacter sp. TaxID=205 RepID=UPI003F9FE7F8